MSQEKKQPIPAQFRHILSQLEDLIRLALEVEQREVKESLPVDGIYKQLQKINDAIQVLEEGFSLITKEMQLSESDIERMRQKLLQSQSPEKQVYDKLTDLSGQCEEAQARLRKELVENREQAKEIPGAPESPKKMKRSRKDKFKSIGGKKGWMPT